MLTQNHLSQKERDEILAHLNEKQQHFLATFLKRGKRTEFANILAKEKAGLTLEGSEEIARQWELLDYLDAGPDWQTTSELICDCGRKLRYQYIVENKKTKERKKFGIDHFVQHTGIPARLAKEINKGFERIDYELDDILWKVKTGWELADEGIYSIPNEVQIDPDIQQHLDYDLPLLARQVDRLQRRIAAFTSQVEQKRKRKIERERREQRERQLIKEQEKMSQLEIKRQQEMEERKEASARLAEEIAASEFWQALQSNVELAEAYQLGIIQFIKESSEDTFVASEACDYIIQNLNAPTDTYATGTYYIFPQVCGFLEDLVNMGRIQFVKKVQRTDRLYRIVDPYLLA